MDYEFPDPCGEDFLPAPGASTVDDGGGYRESGREDLPIAWAYAGRGPVDRRGALDPQTLADLAAAAASGAGVRTLYGAGGPPPPPSSSGGGGGDGHDGAGNEIMAVIGGGFLYAAVDRVLNKDKTDNAQALLFALIGGGLIYYGRKG